MHYESAPEYQRVAYVAGVTDGGFAPAPPGFIALVPLPIGSFREPIAKGGCRSIPLGSVEATESALGLLPSMALSSAQFRADCTRAGRALDLEVDSKRMKLSLEGKWSVARSPSPQGGTQHVE